MEVKLVAYCKLYISLTRLCVCSTWQCVWRQLIGPSVSSSPSMPLGMVGSFRNSDKDWKEGHCPPHNCPRTLSLIGLQLNGAICSVTRDGYCVPGHMPLAVALTGRVGYWLCPSMLTEEYNSLPLGIPSTSKPWSVLWRRKTKTVTWLLAVQGLPLLKKTSICWLGLFEAWLLVWAGLSKG